MSTGGDKPEDPTQPYFAPEARVVVAQRQKALADLEAYNALLGISPGSCPDASERAHRICRELDRRMQDAGIVEDAEFLVTIQPGDDMVVCKLVDSTRNTESWRVGEDPFAGHDLDALVAALAAADARRKTLARLPAAAAAAGYVPRREPWDSSLAASGALSTGTFDGAPSGRGLFAGKVRPNTTLGNQTDAERAENLVKP